MIERGTAATKASRDPGALREVIASQKNSRC